MRANNCEFLKMEFKFFIVILTFVVSCNARATLRNGQVTEGVYLSLPANYEFEDPEKINEEDLHQTLPREEKKNARPEGSEEFTYEFLNADERRKEKYEEEEEEEPRDRQKYAEEGKKNPPTEETKDDLERYDAATIGDVDGIEKKVKQGEGKQEEEKSEVQNKEEEEHYPEETEFTTTTTVSTEGTQKEQEETSQEEEKIEEQQFLPPGEQHQIPPPTLGKKSGIEEGELADEKASFKSTKTVEYEVKREPEPFHGETKDEADFNNKNEGAKDNVAIPVTNTGEQSRKDVHEEEATNTGEQSRKDVHEEEATNTGEQSRKDVHEEEATNTGEQSRKDVHEEEAEQKSEDEKEKLPENPEEQPPPSRPEDV